MMEHPIANDPAGVDWNTYDGGFTPVCDICGFQGRSREHSAALQAIRRHIATAHHRAILHHRTLQGNKIDG